MAQAKEEPPENGDRVTITLFSVEKSDGTFNESMFHSYDEIQRLKEGLSAAAREAGREPPEFVLSVLLIPDWTRPANSYADPRYQALKGQFLEQTYKTFGDLAGIHDFYSDSALTEGERRYLDGMGIPGVGGLGSCADMMKTRSIYDNRGRRHLNIDSNTKIANFKEFYRSTFGAEEQSDLVDADSSFGAEEQRDLVNASYYDPNYVSVHNKVVYTHPYGGLAKELGEQLIAYCAENQDNEKDKIKNSIYAKAFTAATTALGISRRHEVNADRTVHVANLDHPSFGLSRHVVTAINMSWAPEGGASGFDHLKAISPIRVGDADIDFQAFQYIVKKNTGIIWDKHWGGFDADEDARNALLAISDVERDFEQARQFYIHTYNTEPEKMADLAGMIPNTEVGKKFCREAFNCELAELRDCAARGALPPGLWFKDFEQRLNALEERLDSLGQRLSELRGDLERIGRQLDAVSEQLESLKQRLDSIDSLHELPEARLNASRTRELRGSLEQLRGSAPEEEPRQQQGFGSNP